MPPTALSQSSHPSLLTIIKSSRKPENFWFRVYYTLGSFVVWIGVRVGWTPNQLTVASALVNLIGFVYFTIVPTSRPAIVLTYIIFNIAYVLDWADGQLAFVAKMRSELGQWLDSSLDVFKAAFLSLLLIKTIYAQTGRYSPNGWFEFLVVFAAIGHFVNYALTIHAIHFREPHDGYEQTSFDRLWTGRGLKRYLTETAVSHLREFANLLLTFLLFAVNREAALWCTLVLGTAHWLFALRRVVVIGRRLQIS